MPIKVQALSKKMHIIEVEVKLFSDAISIGYCQELISSTTNEEEIELLCMRASVTQYTGKTSVLMLSYLQVITIEKIQ